MKSKNKSQFLFKKKTKLYQKSATTTENLYTKLQDKLATMCVSAIKDILETIAKFLRLFFKMCKKNCKK